MCPICTRLDTSVDRTLYDDRFGAPGTFALYACAACGHRWLDLHLAAPAIEALYATYYPPRPATAPAAMPRSSAAARVPGGVSVLDIGCGAGAALAYHRARGCTVRGVEADAHAVAAARAVGLDVDHGVFDPARYAPASFDMVTMDQVLEHVGDPVATLAGIHRVLRPGGTLVAAMPNAASLVARFAGERWIHWHAPYHLQFFSRASLATAAERGGLELTELRTITSPEWLSYQWVHALTRPPVGTPSPFWAQRSHGLGIRAVRALRFLGGEAIFTRICDRLGVGDNFIATLRRP